MKIELITQILTLIALLITLFFQIRNFVKYKETDEANVKRIFLMLMTVCFSAHIVLLMFKFSEGFFFTAGVVIFLLLYNDWFEKLRVKIKNPFR